jgi:hypothetical protein
MRTTDGLLWTAVDTAMNVEMPQKAGNVLTDGATGGPYQSHVSLHRATEVDQKHLLEKDGVDQYDRSCAK